MRHRGTEIPTTLRVRGNWRAQAEKKMCYRCISGYFLWASELAEVRIHVQMNTSDSGGLNGSMGGGAEILWS